VFQGCGGLKNDAQALAVRSEGLDMVRHPSVFAAMVLILGTVFEQHSVQLLDVILGRSDGTKPSKIISIASA